ncbi:ATP-binding protein [Sorangium sp. So ce1335]|uniref:ATP-binding protein n=1 Tax=Sorangium sp. So ce1335 TaxID=3133335 RepID=UPI003F627300
MSDFKERKRTPPILRESQKEQLLRYIVSTFPYSIWWKDRNCVYIGTNELNARGAGLSRPDDIIGLTDHDLPWTAEEAEHYIRVDKAVMASGEPLLNIEETQRQADGSQRYLLTCKVPLKDEDGEVFGILGAWTDITDRKLTELALARAKDEAERANRAKSDFLATVSHELRTPLTLILSPLERLIEAQHGALPRDVRDELELIRRNTARLLNVVSDLLDFSKAEAARMDADWELVDVNRITAQMLNDIRPSALSRGRALAMTGDALGAVALDRYKYERILLNLISNALKFSHRGGHIEVSLRALDGAWFELGVRDEGIGIAADDLGKLFSKFTQVDGSVKRRYEGTGLGLSLVKHFAELMHGAVSIESELGKGTTVRVRLPRSIPGAAQDGAAGAAEGHAADAAGGRAEHLADVGPSSTPSTAQTRRWLSALPPAEASPDGLAPGQIEPDAGPRAAAALPDGPPGPPAVAPPAAGAERPLLLLVDDNPDMRQFMRSLLSPSYRLLEAANGLEAQRLIERSPPHVVVSDVMMPRMSGVELTAWLKAHPVLRHIPIVLVTARADDEAVASGLDGGADEYLVKPFSPRELLARVRSMVRLYESYRQLGAEQAEIARHSGMAQVAMDVLHSAGNTLNSAGVAVDLVRDRAARSRLPRLKRALAELLGGDAGAAAPADAPRGESLRRYVELALAAVEQEQRETAEDIERVREQLDVLRDALRAQERYAYRNAYRTERLSANEVIRESLRVHGAALGSARVAVRLDLRPVDDIVANRHDLLTILYNLLDNARAAVVEGGPSEPWIAISTWHDGADVCCAVEDNGPGIPEAARIQVFQYGFSTREGASGIGLHFSANRMKLFGGSIRVEGGREGGARVVLTFAPASAAAGPGGAGAAAAGPGGAAPGAARPDGAAPAR